jgi:hypothetical protein
MADAQPTERHTERHAETQRQLLEETVTRPIEGGAE